MERVEQAFLGFLDTETSVTSMAHGGHGGLPSFGGAVEAFNRPIDEFVV